MPGHKVLLVEDDLTLLDVLEYNLIKENFIVLKVGDGLQAIETARREQPDLIILDLMLPKMNGLSVCRILRQEMIVPILMLTAKAEEIDKIVGLELGADDYMTKPFSMRELMARVRAMLRRTDLVRQDAVKTEEKTDQKIQAGSIEIDLSHHIALNGGVPLELSPKEFDLLVFLSRNHGQVFSRDILLEKVWGYDFGGDTRTVDVHIRWLREKVEENPEKPVHLVTVRGFGYKLEV